MSLCKIEIFNTDMVLVHHDFSDTSRISIDDDALAAGTTSVDIRKTNNIPKIGFIRISGDIEYVGCIVGNTDKKTYTTVTFKPLYALFEFDALINTNDQGKVAIEKTIQNAINEHYINNSDSLQNLSCLQVSTTSSTKWGLNLKSDEENMHHTIVNLYDTIIVKALQKYGVSLSFIFDIPNKKLKVSIGKNTSSFIIDADMSNVIVQTFDINQRSNSTNKLRIYNKENYTEFIDYYLHENRSYSTSNTNRITPVVCGLSSAIAEYEEKDGVKNVKKTFAEAASEVASDEFSGIEWTDLIELQVSAHDTIVNPMELVYGQTVKIIYKGMQYNTIFTGRKIANTITLVFGTVRKDYTKRIRLER